MGRPVVALRVQMKGFLKYSHHAFQGYENGLSRLGKRDSIVSRGADGFARLSYREPRSFLAHLQGPVWMGWRVLEKDLWSQFIFLLRLSLVTTIICRASGLCKAQPVARTSSFFPKGKVGIRRRLEMNTDSGGGAQLLSHRDSVLLNECPVLPRLTFV